MFNTYLVICLGCCSVFLTVFKRIIHCLLPYSSATIDFQLLHAQYWNYAKTIYTSNALTSIPTFAAKQNKISLNF